MVFGRMHAGIIILLVNEVAVAGINSQEAVLYPTTPAYTILHQPITFQCKASVSTDWRSTSFFDETYNNGIPIIALFNKISDGTCGVSSVSNIKYGTSCDLSVGIFNLTIRSVEIIYHNQYIRCRVQFGTGTSTDIYSIATSTMYVRTNIESVTVTSNNITSDADRSVVIQCTATSRPTPTVQWIKIDSEGKASDITLSSTYTVSGDISGDTVNSVLTFKFTPVDNRGYLYCKAENSISTKNSSLISLNIQFPPTEDPSIQQTPLGALTAGSKAVLTCTVSGGNPLAMLSWNCTGNTTKTSQDSIAFSSLIFMVDRTYNGKICNCLAIHAMSKYRRSVQVQLDVYYPPDNTPSIIQTPVGAIITGTSALLTCLLTGGNPFASLSWNCTGTFSSNSSESTSYSSIEIIANRQKHGVVCSCLATHFVANYKQTAHHVLDVIYPPDDIPVIKQAQPGPIDTDSPVELICSVYGGNPLPSLSWDCAGRITSNASESTVISTLVFTVDKNYNGRMCTCSASHRISSYRPIAQHKLIVYYRPSKPILQPKPELPWFQGNLTTIECVSSSGNPKSSFEWKRNAEKTLYNGTVLTVGPLSKDDNGVGVTCLVKNEYTEQKGIVVESELLVLNVEYLPDVEINTSPVYALEGDNVTLTCNTTGNPTPKTQWLSEDTNITRVLSEHFIFKLNGIDRTSHKSRYTCRAWANSAKFGVLSKHKSLETIVYYRPNITKIESLSSLIVPENQSATLRCQVDSNPLANITWFFEDAKETLYSEEGVVVSNLTISSAQWYNTGTYRCIAVNSINGKIVKDAKEVKLYVGCKPRVDVRHSNLRSVIAVDENSELNLTVNLIAYPPPITQWIFDKPINSTDIIGKIVHSTAIFIANVSRGDLGEYTVHSSNDYGHVFIHLWVVIKGMPNPPYDVVVVCNSQLVTVMWKPGFNGGDQQTFYILYWSDDVDKIASNNIHDSGDSTTLFYVIKSVTPNARYKLQVVSSNSYGKAKSLISECTTDSEDQLSQKGDYKIFNIAVIAMLSTGGALFVSAILLYACYCRKTRRVKTRKGKASLKKYKTADGGISISLNPSGYVLRQNVEDSQRYESIRNTATADTIMDSALKGSNDYVVQPYINVKTNSHSDGKNTQSSSVAKTYDYVRVQTEIHQNRVDAVKKPGPFSYLNMNSIKTKLPLKTATKSVEKQCTETHNQPYENTCTTDGNEDYINVDGGRN